jgi:hypothetical protein
MRSRIRSDETRALLRSRRAAASSRQLNQSSGVLAPRSYIDEAGLGIEPLEVAVIGRDHRVARAARADHMRVDEVGDPSGSQGLTDEGRIGAVVGVRTILMARQTAP